MQRFRKIFKQNHCQIIGMIHVDALPGTPSYAGNLNNIIDKARYEANIFKKYKVHSVLIENMNDIPYVQDEKIGPEIIATMTRISNEVRNILPKPIPIGIQILACGNKQALAVAKASDYQFIRVEGFVFAHIADEGFTNSNAGELLRYRKQIDADNILIFTDIKKKHSSHTITSDISLLETACAAELFLTDGVILTGSSTGYAADPKELDQVYKKVSVPILIGSGVTKANVGDYFKKSNGIIIGSYFKKDGFWKNDLSEKRIESFMEIINENKLNL